MIDSGSNAIEEWARRRSYVRLRQLFDDEPLLSTISEGDESLVQYLSTLPCKGLETERDEYRATSPLPELIIEVVPRRPIQYYDESEEFYKNLEKEMRRLYRRDFLHIYSNSSSDEENEFQSNPETMNVDNNFNETIESDHKSPSLEASDNLSVDEEESENESDSNELLNDSEYNICSPTITKSDIEKSLPYNTTNLLEEFKTKSIADEQTDTSDTTGEDKSVYESRVEYESRNSARVLSLGKEKDTETCEEESEAEEEQATEELVENNGEDKSVYESRVDYESRNSTRVLSLEKEKGTETCEEESEAEEEQETDELAENNGASSTKSDTCLIPEPDVIRLRRYDRRLSSLSIPSYSQGFEAEIFELHKKNLSMEVELEVGGKIGMTNMETLLSENTPEITIVNNATSTPKSQGSVVFRITSSKKYTKRFEPYSPHKCTSNRKRMCNQTQQTSFSEDESDTQSLWRSFFVGTPRFYRLV